MSTKYLGDTFDIHGGGVDLVFPHHENEIAQAEAAGKPFARWWVHNGLLTVNGEKMSKSLKNFITVEQASKTCEGSVDVLKMFFLGTHYRNPIDYSNKNLKAAEARYQGLLYFLRSTDAQREDATIPTRPLEATVKLEQEFEKAMDEDLNTPQALAALDLAINRASAVTFVTKNDSDDRQRAAKGNAVVIADALLKVGRVLGLFTGYKPLKLGAELRKLIHERETARQRKDFGTSDEIRRRIGDMGFLIADTAGGPVVLPK